MKINKPEIYMKKRGFLEMPFSWLFALIVGAFILFLAIFIAIKLINVEETGQGAELSKDISVIMNPLETEFQEGVTTSLKTADIRIYNDCDSAGYFGRQGISTSQKSFGRWTDPSLVIYFNNKYIFSETSVEGKEFYLFSKPLEMPFKIADLIYLIPKDKEYCFVNAPDEIKKEISDLKLTNIANESNCKEDAEKVCFDRASSGCDVVVRIEGSVQKQGKTVYFYGDSLMYAAIFSDPLLYECQLKRLMKRTDELATIYNKKALMVAQKNCNTDLDLAGLGQAAGGFQDSQDILAIAFVVDDIKRKSNLGACKLW